MITISLCMIVKNESAVLARCLDTVADLCDEIVIVDTGSTDNTKEIAARYTDKIYDFEWVDDFAAARNFSFSKATCDYIYVPDADEVLDESNRHEFMKLKQCMVPEVEIVQMRYHTVSHNTVLNVEDEYRPKLFKRLREFTWVDPIHETVRLEPLVFDSDVVITHMPQSDHSARDFDVFEKALARDGRLSRKIALMYATELYKCGDKTALENALQFFKDLWKVQESSLSKAAACVLARFARLCSDSVTLMKLGLRYMADKASAEICFETGHFFFDRGDYEEACIWFSNALDAPVILDIHKSGDETYGMLARCYEKLAEFFAGTDEGRRYSEIAATYREEEKAWKMPVEEPV